ncbi:hypothetical protein GPUN_0394 [Glaciecola punicea ACAM 611]|jgi:hypothetical protein|uniref:Uncharacterized protein n=1 Tax=Glaciecola punicea ACAM 611 TaxID=1121923 RepID=H5T8A0_9ALTE|nr:hypothetical protein [Glaciecola punicea]OFA29910.1 hypothetical protein BAE46_12830 [Glaciecola punicea]GAB54541.1 hypothetical protein GPUN_0394 [Glaciecola punicea ACAM 611]
MKTAIKILSPAVLAMLLAAPLSQAAAANSTTIASTLSVKTSVAEVVGVREIESGKFEQGIRKSKAVLVKTSTSGMRKPLLDNLCVAHLAIEDIVQADKYCNDAVNVGRASAISYNNRAVMHYVSGDLDASLEDLDSAGEFRNFQKMVARNHKIVSQQSMLSKN